MQSRSDDMHSDTQDATRQSQINWSRCIICQTDAMSATGLLNHFYPECTISVTSRDPAYVPDMDTELLP